MTPSINPKRNLIRGAFWAVGTRWIIKAIGFLNTIIMARLLLPEDYGIVATATILIGLIQTFLDFGARVYLLRARLITTDEIDSAWTLSIIQGLISGTLVIILTPICIWYFNEPNLIVVMPTLGLCLLLSGATNIGTTIALKEYKFSLDFKIQTTMKLASLLFTVTAGFILRDYRALMLGIVAGYLTPIVLSYLWHPYRPRWNTSKIPDIWEVTKWLMIANVANQVLEKLDQFLAAKISNSTDFGLYNVGSDLGQLPVSEVGPAMMRAILPVLSSLKDDTERLRNAVIKTIGALNTVIWPISMGVIAVSQQATELLLGAKWSSAAVFVSAFSLISAIKTSCYPAKSYLVVLGHTKILSTMVWIELLFFASFSMVLVPEYGLIGLAYAKASSSFVNTSSALVNSTRIGNLPPLGLAHNLFRPILGALIMLAILLSIEYSTTSPHLNLALSILTGATLYSSWCIATWLAVGKPDGLEKILVAKIMKSFKQEDLSKS